MTTWRFALSYENHWINAAHVFCTNLKQISDDHQYTDEPFAALADFKQIIEKARKRTRHELLRNTLVSPGAKHWVAASAMRACRNRHFGTLMHCCAAWEPVVQCFDKISCECTNFQCLASIQLPKKKDARSRTKTSQVRLVR